MTSENALLFRDVRIFDGFSFIEHGHVFVEHGKIVLVSAGDPPASLRSAHQVLSCPGQTLLPGLIDAHIHADRGNVPSIEQSLRFGITTVMDQHNEKAAFEKLRKVSVLFL